MPEHTFLFQLQLIRTVLLTENVRLRTACFPSKSIAMIGKRFSETMRSSVHNADIRRLPIAGGAKALRLLLLISCFRSSLGKISRMGLAFSASVSQKFKTTNQPATDAQ